MNRTTPTAEEIAALERIEAMQSRSVYGVIATIAAMLLLQLVPNQYAAVSTVVSIVMVLGALSLLIYRACFLRCPRCSGWIAIAKCPACGLKLRGKSGKDLAARV